MSAERQPLITANRVTVARLIPLPMCAWMLYQGQAWWWVAFWVGSLVAMTDFIDGYLARKHGPTILGGLLDPIADKVFIAAFFLPLADIGLVPAWTVALMFVREFAVTGIRSAYKQRGMSMKTSYFAKVKTWVQMQAVFFMMLVLLMPRTKTLLLAIILAVVAGSLILTAIVSAKRKKLFVSGVIMAAACGGAAALYGFLEPLRVLELTMYITVAVTWLSGADYLLAAFPQLRAAGDFNRSDAVRLLGAVSLPILAVLLLRETSAPIAPVLVLISLELAVGGLDNLMSHHQKQANAMSWGLRVLGAVSLLGLALALAQTGTGDPVLVDALVWTAMVTSAVGVALEFWRGRDVYLDDEELAPEEVRALAVDD